MADYLVGLDLGQAQDWTAMAVLRRAMVLKADGTPKRTLAGDFIFRYECVHLERFKRGTSYPDVVQAVKATLARPELPVGTKLLIDATGVGRAVVDLFLDEGIDGRIIPITITGGDTPRSDRWNQTSTVGYWVPKSELVSAIRATLESGRLKIAKLRVGETLKKELLEFRVKITKAANETYAAREGEHDDLVLAVAMPVWFGGRRECSYMVPEPVAVGPNLPETLAVSDEERREREALDREEADDLAERERKWHSPDNPIWWDQRGW